MHFNREVKINFEMMTDLLNEQIILVNHLCNPSLTGTMTMTISGIRDLHLIHISVTSQKMQKNLNESFFNIYIPETCSLDRGCCCMESNATYI